MTKTSRRELYARRETELRVSWEFGVGLAVVEEVLEGEVALERGDEVLRRDAVACAVAR